MFNSMKIRSFLLSGLVFCILLLTGYCLILGVPKEDDSLFYVIFSYGLLGVFPLLWFTFQFQKQKYSLSAVFYMRGLKKQLPLIPGLVFLLIVFSLGAYWLTNYTMSFIFPNMVEEMLSEEVPVPSNTFYYLLLGINICLAGPIAEEFIFRGLLLKRLAEKTNLLASAVITNVLFGLFHSDIIGGVMFGFIVTLLYLKTDNILVPVAAHILNNSTLMALSIFSPDSPEFTMILTVDDLHTKMVPNLVILVVSAVMLVFYISKNINVLTKENMVRPTESDSILRNHVISVASTNVLPSSKNTHK